MSNANHKMGMKAKSRLGNTIIYILLILISVIWLTPFVCIVFQSFNVNSTRLTGDIIPKQWGMGNYEYLLKGDANGDGVVAWFDTEYVRWYRNTLVMAAFVAVIQPIMVLCMSYTLSRFRFRLRGALMRFMLVLGLFPGMLTLIILYNVLKNVGLTQANAVPGLIIVYVASSAMGYYVSKGFFDTIPMSLDEAARVDGATRAQVLNRIILPLSKPIVIYTILTAFMAPWADFVLAKYISFENSQGMNVAVALNKWLDKDNIDSHYTHFCAGGVLIAIPITILFMCLQKYYVEGVTGGSVKG